MNAVTTTETTALAPRGMGFDLSPQTFEQAVKFSQMLADSDLVPKDFKGKPGNCLIAMQWGSELGLKPLQALSNIAVVNGRAALWGDAVIALVRSSPLCEYVQESDDGHTATCRAKRRGEPEQVVTFSMEDARQAGLAGKQGPWTQYPKRMRQMRARAFALRDVFADVLRGMPVAEEVQDMPAERHMGDVERVEPAPEATKPYPADQFEANLPAWQKVIEGGRKSAEDLIVFAQSRNPNTPFTEEQKAKLRSFKPVKNPEATDVQPKGEASAPATTPSCGAPVITFAQVNDKLHNAKDMDTLNTAADLIGEVADPQQRTELTAIYETRAAALEPQ